MAKVSTTSRMPTVRSSQREEHDGLQEIGVVGCEHWEDGDYLYCVREMEDVPPGSSRVRTVFNKVPNPLSGRKPPPNTAEFHHYGGGKGEFSCLLLPIPIPNNLVDVTLVLDRLDHVMTDRASAVG